MKDYLKYDGIAVLAHRGGALESYENTLESFDYSIGLGCKYIETDVQLSSDGVPYIFHDEDLKRLTGSNRPFHSHLSSEINDIKLFDQFKIPTLEETLITFPNTYFQIDFKSDEVVLPAIDIIRKTNSINRICIASFDSDRLEVVRNELPDVCLSMGPKEVLALLLKSYGLNKNDIPGDCLQIPIYKYGLKLVTKRFVDFVHSQDLKIMVWTINDKKNMDYLISLGVDGIITDKPKFLFDLIK